MELELLVAVKKFNFIVLIPPGVPCLRVYFKKRKSNQLDEVVYAILSDRKNWYRALTELAGAYHITRDLYDSTYARRALHRVLLTHVMEAVTRKSTASAKIFSVLIISRKVCMFSTRLRPTTSPSNGFWKLKDHSTLARMKSPSLLATCTLAILQKLC